MERYVLIRPGALGDALLALPTLALLRRERPGAHVTLVARGEVLSLARASSLADATSEWSGAAWAALFADDQQARAPGEPRAMVCDAAVVAWLVDADSAVARNLAVWGARQTVIVPGCPPRADAPKDATPREHTALLLARTLERLGIVVPATAEALVARMPPLRTGAGDTETARQVWGALDLGPAQDRVVALHTGSGGAAKRWPPERFAALARRLMACGWHPMLVEGPDDAAVTAAMLAAVGPSGTVDTRVGVARGLPVGALAALLRRCAAYVGNDSGVSHLAALAGVPTLALFGPSDPARWAPLGPHVRILSAPGSDLTALEAGAVWDALLREMTIPGA